MKLELYFEKMAERSCKNCGKTYKKLLLHLHFNETCCGQYTNTEKDEIRLAVKTYRASKRKEYNRTANKRNRQKKETATKNNNPNLKIVHDGSSTDADSSRSLLAVKVDEDSSTIIDDIKSRKIEQEPLSAYEKIREENIATLKTEYEKLFRKKP